MVAGKTAARAAARWGGAVSALCARVAGNGPARDDGRGFGGVPRHGFCRPAAERRQPADDDALGAIGTVE